MRAARGLLVVFEGVEGSGKSTQIGRLREQLTGAGYAVITVREPGGTVVGEEIRVLLRSPARQEAPLSPVTELLLFNAARAELTGKIITPALAGGTVVICDRFTGSTIAYQGHGRGLPWELVRAANEIGAGGVTPDLTILLDLDVAAGLARKRGEDDDHYIGAETQAFHERVCAGFREMARDQGWTVVNGGTSPDEVAVAVWAAVSRVLPQVFT